MNGTSIWALGPESGWVRSGTHDFKHVLMSSRSGYGATTFPGLTEALIYEKNMTLVQYEAERLEKLFGALGKEIAL